MLNVNSIQATMLGLAKSCKHSSNLYTSLKLFKVMVCGTKFENSQQKKLISKICKLKASLELL